MLTINNRPDGTIADTDYWQSEYNARGLAYLSGHHHGLRLLLPTAHATEWLAEIKTGKRAAIEPPVRQGYTNHIDIVFDDGTSAPFSLCIDRTQQLDTALRSGNTRLLVYAGSLQAPFELPCTINLPDAPKQNYLTHATAGTGHSRRSYRSEVDDDVVEVVKSWLPDLMAGRPRGVLGDRYAVRQEWSNSKSIGFIVGRLDDLMRPVDIVRIAVCRHSKRAAPSWQFVGGKGAPPRVPFVAADLLTDNIEADDLMVLPVIADFERCLAWAWLEYTDDAPTTRAKG
nr:MAG TPA: hypothetical protein [Caudoviricetes sp.]